MNCKYNKIRTKKYIKYGYCTLYKKEVPIFCKECKNIEYKSKKTLKKQSSKHSKNEKRRTSIIYQDLTKCCVCGSIQTIELNEVFEGSYRHNSIKFNMVMPVCRNCHNKFHNDSEFNLYWKIIFEKEFLKEHSIEEFIKYFGMDYRHKKRSRN